MLKPERLALRILVALLILITCFAVYLGTFSGVDVSIVLVGLFSFAFILAEPEAPEGPLQADRRTAVLPLIATASMWVYAIVLAALACIRGVTACGWLDYVLAVLLAASGAWMGSDLVRHGLEGFLNRRNFSLCFAVLLFLSAYFVFSYDITVNPQFHNDEHYMVKTAFGLINTGRPVIWDFVHQVPMETYDRALLYNQCLALVYHITGLSVGAGRMVSAFFAMLLSVSAYWVTKKLFKSEALGVITAVLLTMFSENVYLARMIRMYSMSSFFCVWMIYFALRAIHCENPFSGKRSLARFIKRNLDYHLGYLAIFFVLAAINFFLVANSMFLLLGLYTYVLLLALFDRKRKYAVVAIVGCLVLMVMVYCYFVPEHPLAVMREIHRILVLHIRVHEITKGYLWGFLRLPFGYMGGLSLVMFGGYYAVAHMKHTPAMSAMLLMYLGSLAFFLFLADHMAIYRYMIFAYYPLILVVCYVLLALYRHAGKWWRSYLSLTMVICLSYLAVDNYMINYQPESRRFDLVGSYAKIETALDTKEPFGYCSYHYHSEYLTAYTESVYYPILASKDMPLSENGQYLRSELMVLVEMGLKYPDGVFVFENLKAHLVTNQFAVLRKDWLDQISGDGLDETNVNIYAYHFRTALSNAAHGHAWAPGTRIAVEMRDGMLYCAVDVTQFSGAEDVLALRVKGNDGSARHYQLLLPKVREGLAVYLLDEGLALRDAEALDACAFESKTQAYRML